MELQTPISLETIKKLKVGDVVYLTGVIYTGRDAAHKKIVELTNKGEKLPFELESNVIYYVGPSPTRPGDVIGSAGPTSSYRMDAYIETVLPFFSISIGKGPKILSKRDFKKQRPLLSAAGGRLFLVMNHQKK